MTPVRKLIEAFQRMNAEHWAYEWGAARTGVVDCSGAFVWAYEQEGESIYHGSNRIARSYVLELLPISEAKPGMAAFKARQPGEDYYALPQGYYPGGAQYNGDLNDYHHIGLVDDDPRFVLNGRSVADGFKRNPITDGWDYVGYLKNVRYDGTEEVEPVAQTAYVRSNDGNPVKLRKDPSTKNPYIDKIPAGTEVQVTEQADGWATVITPDGVRGYMMSQFLEIIEAEALEDEPAEEEMVTLVVSRTTANELYNALLKAGWS